MNIYLNKLNKLLLKIKILKQVSTLCLPRQSRPDEQTRQPVPQRTRGCTLVCHELLSSCLPTDALSPARAPLPSLKKLIEYELRATSHRFSDEIFGKLLTMCAYSALPVLRLASLPPGNGLAMRDVLRLGARCGKEKQNDVKNAQSKKGREKKCSRNKI